MKTQEMISQKFAQLITEGTQILKNVGWDGDRYERFPARNDFFRFRTEAMNLIHRACGGDSDHYRELKRLGELTSSPGSFGDCFGVVEAANRDFTSGILFDMRSLIAAELLGDFIEQSEDLLQAGYYIPAASLAGAVLEDTLRKLCDKNGITVPESTKINSLNAELLRSNVYDKLVQKRITAIADIRNNADHGHFDKFTKSDVDDMVKWIRGFAADYLK